MWTDNTGAGEGDPTLTLESYKSLDAIQIITNLENLFKMSKTLRKSKMINFKGAE